MFDKYDFSVAERFQRYVQMDTQSDIRNALYYIGEVIGAVTNDEILGNIFSRFCIGK